MEHHENNISAILCQFSEDFLLLCPKGSLDFQGLGVLLAAQTTFPFLKIEVWEFPGRPVVRTRRFLCLGPGFSPWSGN